MHFVVVAAVRRGWWPPAK